MIRKLPRRLYLAIAALGSTVNHKDRNLLQHLPLEIILLISENLELHELYQLSNTCRLMRALLWTVCHDAIQKLNHKEYFNFLFGVAYSSPDLVACLECCSLHQINLQDKPYSYDRLKDSCQSFEGMYKNMHHFGLDYGLTYRHVQLALKYERLARHQAHSQRLLKSHMALSKPPGRSVSIRFEAQPRIIQGRFILRTAWQYKSSSSHQPLSMESISPLFICTHLNLLRRAVPGVMEENLLLQSMMAALNQLGIQELGSCRRCHTDYSIVVHPDEATVQVWQDFGSTGDPNDPCWRSQIWTTDASEFEGPCVSHEPNSVVRLWLTE